MRWQAPSFWWKEKADWRAYCLMPISWLYRFVQWIHTLGAPLALEAPCPVISIGNLVMGGAGKTPITLALGKLLQEEGWEPVIVTRGFQGSLKGPVWVDSSQHSFQEVGDEALLLAQAFPTCVAKRRADILSVITVSPRTIILMDDGHQHNSLVKNLSLLVVNDQQKHGNACVFPAGPLREDFMQGMRRADAIVGIGTSFSEESEGTPFFKAMLRAFSSLKQETRVVGFAGLGYPEKFRRTLKDLTLDVQAFFPFPDHFPYTLADMQKLDKLALHHEARLVTTEKDLCRIPSSFRDRIMCVILEVVWDNSPALKAFMKDRLCPS